jgi:hypothetical protein
MIKIKDRKEVVAMPQPAEVRRAVMVAVQEGGGQDMVGKAPRTALERALQAPLNLLQGPQ